MFSFIESSKCENKETYCDKAGPDCSESKVKQDCQKYCGICSSCVDEKAWCEYSDPNCTKPFVEKNCKKTCGFCGGIRSKHV